MYLLFYKVITDADECNTIYLLTRNSTAQNVHSPRENVHA